MRYTITPPQAICEQGQRPNQEDSIWPRKGSASVRDSLFLVCDGMGGHESGEVASGIVSQTVASFIAKGIDEGEFFSDSLLREAVAAAYDELDANDRTAATGKAMGTTLALLYVGKGVVTAAHMGDSRIYQIRPTTQEVIYRSRDHSLVYDLFLAGEISEEQMAHHPQKNVITRCLMPHQEKRQEPDIRHLNDVRPGDYFFLCSDGMLERMNDRELVEIISDEQETDEMKAAILRKYTQGNSDNHSAWLIHVKEVVQEISDLPPAVASEPCVAAEVQAPATYYPVRKHRWMGWLIALLVAVACFAAYYLLTPCQSAMEPRAESDFQDPLKNSQPLKTPSAPKKKSDSQQRQKPASTDTEQEELQEGSARPLFMDKEKEEENAAPDGDIFNKIKKTTPQEKEQTEKDASSHVIPIKAS